MLLNYTNHPSNYWPDAQKQAAIEQFEEIQDLPFPNVDPNATAGEVRQLAKEYESKIRKIDPTAVHIMGELNFTFCLVEGLKALGYPCYASTSRRKVAYDEEGN